MTRLLIAGGMSASLIAALGELSKTVSATELKLTTRKEYPPPEIFPTEKGKQVAQWKQETKGSRRK